MGAILITGGSGSVGRNYLEYLLAKQTKQHYILTASSNIPVATVGNRTDVSVCNLTDKYAVESLFKHNKIDTIIHLAAKASPRLDGVQDIIDVNVKGTLNLLEYCQEGTEFIFASSIMVYGSSLTPFYEKDKLEPNSVYGISKKTCEELIQLYFRKGKVRPRILRFPGLVGKYMHHGRIAEVLKGKRDFKLFGKPPGPSMPYLSMHKACEALYLAQHVGASHITANICPIDNSSLSEVYSILEEQLHIKLNLEWNNDNSPSDFIYCDTNIANYQMHFKTNYSKQEIINGLKEYAEQ